MTAGVYQYDGVAEFWVRLKRPDWRIEFEVCWPWRPWAWSDFLAVGAALVVDRTEFRVGVLLLGFGAEFRIDWS